MPQDFEFRVHQEWLGYLQPVGLVVSPPALAAAQAFPSKNIVAEHTRFVEFVEKVTLKEGDEPQPAIREFPRFATEILGWEPGDLCGADGGEPVPEGLEVVLSEYNETLRPTYAVPEVEKNNSGESRWLMLIQRVALGLDLDETPETDDKDHRWQASPQARFERLLRETSVPIGLLSNGTSLRLVYAPRGETSGHLTFPVQAMTEVAGRPIFAALLMLLSAERLFSLPDKQRLPAILLESRKYQNLVSTKLAEQVLAALYELLRGFQAANEQRHGELLRDVLKVDPNHVYGGLLRVLMRLVFLLYAEDRGLLSNDEVYQKYYSVIGLFERLRADAGRHTDTMDHRPGAWAQLLTLFRLVYDGGQHGGLKLLARKGYLFDPDRYPFLEGRARGSSREPGARLEPPRVSDGVVYRVLQNLLILDGERLSYRTLDVEQIGSVYETMMGFTLEVAQGRSIAIKPTKAHGAPTTINLDELLSVKPADRMKWLKERTGQTVTGQTANALKDATTPEGIVAALDRKVAHEATPNIVPPGAMILQPSEERRKSGSHYTPRSLTEPIVRTTLRPILERIGQNPTPGQILDLKVCDPAMGSGAFLVEACRQLSEALVKAWHAHNQVPTIPPDEDEILHARRIVAQRCLYGVDKNPMAVDLAKLSLWLATLAKDHPFTFLDHALRAGDSLVGLSREQIAGFHWATGQPRDFARPVIEGKIREAIKGRLRIQNADDFAPYLKLHQELALVEEALDRPRFYGDVVISAFFAAANERKRKDRLDELAEMLAAHLAKPDFVRLYPALESARNALRAGAHPVVPFHWSIEFPEIFERENPGFDAILGNPPFMGGWSISPSIGQSYLEWLLSLNEGAHGVCDLVAHFFRMSFSLIRRGGCFGLIATNTIAQGDTRDSGLSYILERGGVIYEATRRYRWPGQAAVVVSIVHMQKPRGPGLTLSRLDGESVERISAFLLDGHQDRTPDRLVANSGRCFCGAKIYGQGFVLTHDEVRALVEKNPGNQDRIFPYLGGEDVNTNARQSHERFVINFGTLTLDQAAQWPDLLSIVEQRVKPERDAKTNNAIALRQKEYWWRFRSDTPKLFDSLQGLTGCLVQSQVSSHLAVARTSIQQTFAHTAVVTAFDSFSALSVLQSRPHEIWARFFASSMKDDLRYTPSDCFETFPFPKDFQASRALESAGRLCYEFRADLMIRRNEGLTKTYNRFHDPDERLPDILKLRDLHAAMDRAVLDAYGWTDLQSTCEFLLDYEEDEDEGDTGGGRRRKKPWRYRWPDDFRDEVLARLLELNRQRAAEERLGGAAAGAGKGKAAKKTTGRRKTATKMPDQPELFDT
jgi:N-6 DNA Methylase